MCQYVDGLVVEVEEAADTSRGGLQRPVPGQHVGVELQVPRHIPPVQQRNTFHFSRRVRATILRFFINI